VADVALSGPGDEQPASTATATDTTSGAVCHPCRVEVIDRGRRNGAIPVTFAPLDAEPQHDRQRNHN
jgi:hypothetical protein